MENNMNFKDFIDYVTEHVLDDHPELKAVCDVTVAPVKKNNGIELTGLSIRMQDINIAPTIYLENYYKDYQAGRPMESVMEDLYNVYEANRPDIMGEFKTDFLESFDNCWDRITCRLVNGSRNAEALDGLANLKFGDLAITFQVVAIIDNKGLGTINISDRMLEEWGKDTHDLLHAAMHNQMFDHPGQIKPIETVLLDMLAKGDNPNEIPEDFIENLEARVDSDEVFGMYVMTNRYGMYGATAMLEQGLLSDFVDKAGTNVYILPSSVHECIVIPDTGGMDLDQLKSMVFEVNRTQVAPQEVLSDTVYLFDKDTHQLLIAETREPMEIQDPKRAFSIMWDPADHDAFLTTPDNAPDENELAEQRNAAKAREAKEAKESSIHDKLKSAKEQSSAKKEADPLKDMKPDKDKGARD